MANTQVILLWCYGIFNIFVVFEHLIGSYLLFRRRRDYVILLFFSTCNCFYACVNIGFFSLHVARSSKVSIDIYTIYATSMRIPFYWLMIMLTVERFLVVYMHLRYNNSWFDRHKIKLCIAAWVVYISFCIAATFIYIKQDGGNFYNNLLKTKYTLLGHLLIIIVFVAVYGYIYRKIRLLKAQNVNGVEAKQWKIFVPFFIVLSFLTFRGITELVAVFHLKKLKIYIVWIYSFDFFMNGIVYIFLQPQLRNDFRRLFCKERMRVSPATSSTGKQTKPSSSRRQSNRTPTNNTRPLTPNREPDMMIPPRTLSLFQTKRSFEEEQVTVSI